MSHATTSADGHMLVKHHGMKVAPVSPLATFLRIPTINWLVFKIRFMYFVHLRRRLRSLADQAGVDRHDYSVKMLRNGVTSNRPLRLILPLSSIDAIDKSSARTLSVGCRFETELLYLWAYGYRHVRGVDMISYSPYVELGNMHALPYADNSWDVVLLGWVISYSTSPHTAANEILRVTTNGGTIAIAVAYSPNEAATGSDAIGETQRKRLQRVDDLLALWGDHVDKVYFKHDAADPSAEGSCIVIFSIRK